MKKVLILSVFAFFAFAVNAQTDANTSDKTTTEVAQTKDAGASAKSVALGGNAATAADKAANSKGCNDKTKSAACCSSKTADKGGKEAGKERRKQRRRRVGRRYAKLYILAL